MLHHSEAMHPSLALKRCTSTPTTPRGVPGNG